ncbi:ubiquitin-protein ligase, putative [Ricinus communis]|uniref:RING-type E3 ubiquitin transferase n=1 Tax=Ricinus communis TaxID=3988 RepID=B9SAP6_RICCO|nr:ubiquitin-protein ligase, putative [Ricinus communis]
MVHRQAERDYIALMQEGKDLVIYALINHTAVRKLLKKYDKVCFNQGQAFRLQAQNLQIEILQSPWLRELMALHINLRETKIKLETEGPASLDGFSLTFDDNDKPSLSYELFDSLKLDTDLTCPICLDTVFDPVSLTCGHILCYMCACSAASVTIIDGLKAAEHNKRCPLCRKAGVYEGAVHLEELNNLLSRSCPEYWEQRLQSERVERVRQAKEHWELQCRAFLGV